MSERMEGRGEIRSTPLEEVKREIADLYNIWPIPLETARERIAEARCSLEERAQLEETFDDKLTELVITAMGTLVHRERGTREAALKEDDRALMKRVAEQHLDAVPNLPFFSEERRANALRKIQQEIWKKGLGSSIEAHRKNYIQGQGIPE